MFQDVNSSPTAKEVVRSILKFFRGFDAFALPPPSADPNVLLTINNDESQLESAFVCGLELFKEFLKNYIVPKNGVNVGEFVSGEGNISLHYCFLLFFYLQIVTSLVHDS